MVSATVRWYPTFFCPKCKSLTCMTCVFQLDGDTCQTARATMDLLRGEFGEHFISRSGPVNWPPRSWDLTPLDYFLWGYVKAHVYTDKPASIDALDDNIEAFLREIPAEMLERVCQNWTKRMDHLRHILIVYIPIRIGTKGKEYCTYLSFYFCIECLIKGGFLATLV